MTTRTAPHAEFSRQDVDGSPWALGGLLLFFALNAFAGGYYGIIALLALRLPPRHAG